VSEFKSIFITDPLIVAVVSCLFYKGICCVLSDAARYCWNEGSVSWGENYAGSSGLASPKLFAPMHFMEDNESAAQAVCSNL